MIRGVVLAEAVTSIGMGAVAQMFLKLGANRLAALTPGLAMPALAWECATTWQLVLGLGLYGASAMVWIHVLTSLNLSTAYPLVGLSFIFTTLIGVLVLGEAISARQLLGCAAVLVGVALIARG